MKVSVIIPVFNRPAQLVEAARSAIDQTLPPAEIIIVDDGSTDETPAAAASLAREFPGLVKILRIPNGGPGLAREAGRQVARGEFLQYLDSDDVLYPRKFELQLASLEKSPAAAACYGPVRYRYGNGVLASDPIKLTGQVVHTMFPSFLANRWWSTHAPLWRRELTDQAGPWTNLRVHEDWEYDCRIAATGATLCHVDTDTAEVREPPVKPDRRFDSAQLTDRARAMGLIWGHAARAGLGPQFPEAAIFSAKAFLLTRECAAVGLCESARELWPVAQASAAAAERARLPRRLFGSLARAFGFRAAGLASLAYERLPKRGGKDR